MKNKKEKKKSSKKTGKGAKGKKAQKKKKIRYTQLYYCIVLMIFILEKFHVFIIITLKKKIYFHLIDSLYRVVSS